MGQVTIVNATSCLYSRIAKGADTTRTATTTLSADPDLQFSMTASSKYWIRLAAFFDTTAAADFKWRHNGPASPTLIRLLRRWIIPGGTAEAGIAIDTAFSAADLAITSTGTNGGVVTLEGVVANGLNAGTFSFSWAQNTSDAGNTIVRAGSTLEYAKL